MMAGLLIISMVSGAAASVAALAMAMPFWVALLAYPIAGMITLLVIAALLAFRDTPRNGTPGFATARLSALQAGVKH
jgi:membrane protein implicated in regulation of membrane protease activity